jgi:hypothetical protein
MAKRRRKRPRNPKGLGKLYHDVHRLIVQEGNASLIPAGFIAVGILDLIPIPTDIGYFYVQHWLEQNQDKLTVGQRRLVKWANYYGWDFTWYTSVGLFTYYAGKNVREKLILGVGAITAGALATLLWKLKSAEKIELTPPPEAPPP